MKEKTMNKKTIIITTIILLLLVNTTPIHAQNDNKKPTFTNLYPGENEAIRESTPIVKIEYYDESGIDINSVVLKINGKNVTGYEVTTVTKNSITYETPKILEFKDGNHTIYASIADTYRNTNAIEWKFIVDSTIPLPDEDPINVLQIMIIIVICIIISFIVFGLYILYLKKTKKFTWRKYFAQHEIPKEYFLIYIPIIIAFFFVILGFLYISGTKEISQFSYEYILITGLLIAIIPYGIESRIEKKRIERYERGFAQFLFEMADAMRGGLDPTKAIIELSTTNVGILKNQLKRAADALKLGRPFDEIIQVMVKPFKSGLITRYATLIGEASRIGGETAHVIHRAAKDMDDFMKVTQERRRQLAMQVVIIYISFAVLLIIIYELLTIFPSLEGINLNLLGTADIETASQATTVARMQPIELKRKFFHLVLINSIGAGFIMGALTEGKIKAGLLHVFAMVFTTTLFFAILLL